MPKGGKRENAGRKSASPYSPLNDAPVSVRLGTLRAPFDELRGDRDAGEVIRDAIADWLKKQPAKESP